MKPVLEKPQPMDSAIAGSSITAVHDGWLGLPTALYRLPAYAEQASVSQPDPVLAVTCIGQGKRWYTEGLRRRDLYTAPRVFELVGASQEADRIGWQGIPIEGIAIKFPTAVVNRLLHIESRPFNLVTKHEVVDDRVTNLVYALWNEAANGAPHGALYVEGLTLALIGLLSTTHGAQRLPSVSGATRFSAQQRSRLSDFIVSNISQSLSIDRLASLVDMSPDYFSQVFKASFGLSPHAYVVERRIELACRALRAEPRRAIADIASGTGFSSQSHLTEVFRRKIGTTPARWRSEY